MNGGGFGVAAALDVISGGSLARNGHSRDRSLYMDSHQIPFVFQIPISGGSGVYQMNDFLMPKAGYIWSIRYMAASGYSAGTVVAYNGGVIVGGAYVGTGAPFPFSAAGTATIGRGELVLNAGDALVFTATGVTLSTGYAGVQVNGVADCFLRELLPRYIGLD